jgi:hypothetical protein
MKTAVQLALLTLAPLGLLACAGAAPAPGTSARTPRTALEVLRIREPETQWDAKSALRADLDQDGVDDHALAGIRGDRFVVGIVQGPAGSGSRHWALEFPWTTGSQEALCSRNARIKVEDLEEDGRAEPARGKPGKGINLYDGDCDDFHIYWDPESKRFDWWRL